MFISFVIPCFRESQQQLNRALDSLLFLNDLCEWEAWIVDDGSVANKVVDWVAERHDAHLHCIRQENRGQSVARNVALERVGGEYVAFLDADDELIPDQYAGLIRLLQTERPDALGLRYKPTATPYYDGEAVSYMCRYDVVPSVWAYIIRREALGDLRFTPGIFHEDEEFVTLLHLQVHRLIMTPTVAYHYNDTCGSTITSRNEAHLNKRFNDLLGVIGRLKDKLAAGVFAHSMVHESCEYAHSKVQKSSVCAQSEVHESGVYARSKVHESALNRRLHVLAMCLIVNLIRDGLSASFVRDKLRGLKALGFYPLPSFRGIRRYAWIRLLTLRPWMVVLEHCVYRLLKRK